MRPNEESAKPNIYLEWRSKPPRSNTFSNANNFSPNGLVLDGVQAGKDQFLEEIKYINDSPKAKGPELDNLLEIKSDSKKKLSSLTLFGDLQHLNELGQDLSVKSEGNVIVIKKDQKSQNVENQRQIQKFAENEYVYINKDKNKRFAGNIDQDDPDYSVQSKDEIDGKPQKDAKEENKDVGEQNSCDFAGSSSKDEDQFEQQINSKELITYYSQDQIVDDHYSAICPIQIP